MRTDNNPRAENVDYHGEHRLVLSVMALKPDPNRTPWWFRITRMTYSHVVLMFNGQTLWDQPIRGYGKGYKADSWMKAAGLHRDFWAAHFVVELDVDDFLGEVNDSTLVRKAQPIRTILRFLKLWPKPAWNCTSPVRMVCNAMLDFEMKGETPDAIVAELRKAVRSH